MFSATSSKEDQLNQYFDEYKYDFHLLGCQKHLHGPTYSSRTRLETVFCPS